MNVDTHRRFRLRSAVMDSLRRSMAARHYQEVETPILQVQAGGATARPFITHHNTYDIDLYARVASELYLKRLLVGGMDRVFDLGPMFRNEGVDTRHNPEFTMLESNEAFADYRDMMRLCEALFREAADTVGPLAVSYQGQRIDLGADWRQVTMLDAVAEHLQIPDLSYEWPVERLREVCDSAHVHWEPGWGPGKLVDELYDELVESTIVQPTFITNHPKEISPLAHPHRDDPIGHRALRAGDRRPGVRQRLQRADRPDRAAGPDGGAGAGQGPAATRRPWWSTSRTCGRSSSGCRRTRASASGWTGS